MKKKNPVIDSFGNKRWYKGNIYHRDDGPAIEFWDGRKYWYSKGKCYRMEYPDGYKSWYKDGELHREDGPAEEYANGTKYWYKDGKMHRLDGPAVETTYGYKAWYYEGKKINCKSQEKFKRIINLKAFW